MSRTWTASSKIALTLQEEAHPMTSRRVYTAVVVAVFLAINIVAIRWSSGFFRSTHNTALLRYGSHITKLEGQSLLGKGSIEPATNRSNLVLYFSSTTAPGLSLELIRYGEILTQQYGKQGFGVTAIVPGEVPELRTLIEHSLIHYDIIADSNRQIGEKLGLAPDENGVFVFDQQGVCRFSTRRPVSADDLRQLVALEFLHVDPFENSAANQQTIEKGRPLGSWSLLDVRSWERTSLDKIHSGTPGRFVFFTAECSVCSLPSYLEAFGKFERREQASGNSGRTTVLVFDFNFSPADLLDQLQVNNIKAPAYVANEELSAVVDVAQTQALNDEPVVSVETDEQGRVVDISSLNSLAAGRPRAAVVATKSPAVPPNNTGPVYEQMFRDLPLSAYDVAVYQGKYLLTDSKGNRVFIVKDNMEVEREFGRIGSGPGRLLNPGYIDVARDGTIYVQDSGNERIVKFNPAGDYLAEFPVTEYEGMAVGPENEVYLGQPKEDHLITAYSSSGKKLRSFGQLKKYSEIHGAEFAEKDALYKTAINQVRLSTDKDGNIFVSFMLMPLIQKYSPQGKLLFEQKLEAPEIDQLMQDIQKKKYLSSKRGGAEARTVALDPVVEPATGNILVPLVDGSIYVADRDGRKLALLHPQSPPQPNRIFYPFVAGLGAKGELLLTPFPPKRWYRLSMNSSFGKTTATAAAKNLAATTR
jgi:DNA-binding beta-propeller fold protein YncE